MWWLRNQEILVSIRKHTNDLTIWLSEHFQALEGLRDQFGEFHTCLLSSNLKENGNYSQKEKKNVILRCELYACYELLTSWIQSLFQTIQLVYYQTTTKKRNVQKQNGLSWNLLYQQGKNSCVIISIIRCLRNYFNHTMFKMTRKLCYKPVCNCDGHHTRRTPVTFLWPYSQMLKFSVPLFGTFLHNQDFMMWELECMLWTLLYQ